MTEEAHANQMNGHEASEHPEAQEQNQEEFEDAEANGQQFQEIDLTPYEDDSDETLYQKLVLAKQARKQAEEDLRLLTNRIQLLQQEEGKAVKKINETRKRTDEIVDQRVRNVDHLNSKQMMQQQRRMEEMRSAQEHRAKAEAQANRVEQSKSEAKGKIWHGANLTKVEQQMNASRRMQNVQMEQMKAAELNAMIRTQQNMTKQKKQHDFNAKQNQQKMHLQDKMNNEAQIQYEHEQQVAEMERMELELIMRLKNTRALEDAASGELEKAFNDPNPDPKAFAMQQKKMSKTSQSNPRFK